MPLTIDAATMRLANREPMPSGVIVEHCCILNHVNDVLENVAILNISRDRHPNLFQRTSIILFPLMHIFIQNHVTLTFYDLEITIHESVI